MPDGEAILLLHGFTNTHRCWRRLLAAGVSERYEVLAPDIRGHGDAGDVRPVDLGSVLGDVDDLGPARFTLLGYSQGGRIALHAALDRRIAPRVTRLALIGASPGIVDPRQRAARRRSDETLATELEGETIEAFVARWEQTPALAGLAPELAAESRADRLHNTPAGLAAALRGLGTGALEPVWDRLGELSMPATLIAGERDVKFAGLAHEMAGLMPHARVEVVTGAGHQVHLEQPAAVARLLSSSAEL